MLGKNNVQARRERECHKKYQYAIKRLSVGVASVAVSASLLFAGNIAIANAETVEDPAATTQDTTTSTGEEEGTEAGPVANEAGSKDVQAVKAVEPVAQEVTQAPATEAEVPAEEEVQGEETPKELIDETVEKDSETDFNQFDTIVENLDRALNLPTPENTDTESVAYQNYARLLEEAKEAYSLMVALRENPNTTQVEVDSAIQNYNELSARLEQALANLESAAQTEEVVAFRAAALTDTKDVATGTKDNSFSELEPDAGRQKDNGLNMLATRIHSIDTVKDADKTELDFNYSYLFGLAVSGKYTINMELDEKIAPYVKEITAPDIDNKNIRTFTRVKGTNIWEVPFHIGQEGLVRGGLIAVVHTSELGKISLTKTIGEIFGEELKGEEVFYRTYVKDDKGNVITNRDGRDTEASAYIMVNKELPQENPSQDKNIRKLFTGTNSGFSEANGNELDVYFTHVKDHLWNYNTSGPIAGVGSTTRQWQYNYEIAPELLPYIEKVELHKIDWEVNYGASLNSGRSQKSVMKLALDDQGKGSVTHEDMNKLVDFGNITTEPVVTGFRLYLKNAPKEILEQLQSDTFPFTAYFTDKNGLLIPNSQATALYRIKDDRPHNEIYEPAEAEEIIKPYGEGVTEEEVFEKVSVVDYRRRKPYELSIVKITNASNDGQILSELPDGQTAGKFEATVRVTYPDTTYDDVTVPITIGNPKTTVEGDAKPVNPTDESQDTGIVIKNAGEDTKVTATDEDGKVVPVTSGQNGEVYVTPGTKVDGPITVTVTDPDLPEGKKEITVPVNGHEANRDDNKSDKTMVEGDAKPVNPTDESQDTGIVIKNAGEDTKVTATDEDGNEIPAVIGADGKVSVTPGTQVDGPITVTVTDPDLPEGKKEIEVPVNGHEANRDDNKSDKTMVEGDAKPVNPTDESQDTGIVIKNAGEDTKVTATDEDGNEIPAVIGADGKVSVTPGTQVDGPITVTVTDPDLPEGKKEITVPVTGHEADRDDNESDKTTVEDDAKPVNPTNESQDTGIVIKNAGEDTKVTATDEDGNEIPAVIGADGKVSVTPGTQVDGPITVTVTDPDLPEGKKEITVPVTGHEADRDDNKSDKTTVEGEAKPVDPTDESQDTGIVIKNAGEDTKVTAKDEDGNEIPAVIGADGKVSVTPGTQVDGPITVTVTDPDLPEGKKEITVPVNGHEANRDDNESDKTMVEGEAKPVDPTDDPQDTGIVIKNAGEDTKVTAKDEDGNEIPAVIGADGKVSVTPGTQVDGPITVTVTDSDLPEGKKEITVPVTGHEANRDDNKSDKTMVEGDAKPVNPTDESQDTGIVIKNAGEDTKVTAKDEDGNEIPAVIGADGKVSVTPGTQVDGPITVTVTDPDLPEGKKEITVPVTGHEADRDDNKSDKTTVEGEAKPVDPTDESQDTGIVIKNAGEDTKVTATDEDGNGIPAVIGADGKVSVTPGTQVDGPITVTVTDPDLPEGKKEIEVPVNGHEADRDDNKSDKTTVEGDAKPVNPTDESQDTGIVIKNAGEDTTVTAKDEDGNEIPAVIGADGKVSVTPGTQVDGPITVTVTDPDLPEGKKEIEVPVNGHEANRDDNKSDKTTVEGDAKPVNPTDESQDTGIVIKNAGEDTKVTAKDEDGNEIPAVIGEGGKVSVTPGTQVDGPITVTVTDPDLPEGKKEITVPVTGHEADRDDNKSDKTMVEGDAKPVNPTDESQDTGIVIKNAGEDTTVTAKDEDGNEIPAVIGEDGKVSVTPGTQVDGPITVTVTDPDLPEGKKEIEVPVNGHEADRDDNESDKTTVEGDAKPVDPTDDPQDTGIVIKNAGEDTKVTATDEDGKVVPVTSGQNGEVYVTPGTKVDGPITVTVTDPDLPEGKKEITVPVTGHEADRDDNKSDKTMVEGDAKPVNPTNESQDTGIVIKNAGEDTKVTATDEDGNEIPAVIGENGKVSVTPGTQVDGPITVTVTDPDLPEGKKEITVPVTGHEADRDDNESDKTMVEGDAKPVNPTDESQDTGIVIKNAGEDTKVTATDEDGNEIPVVIGEAGKVSVTPGTQVDGPITVTVTDPDLPEGKKEIEVPVNGHEADRDDNESDKTMVEGDAKPVNPTDESQDTGIVIKNAGEDTKVTATDEDGNEIPAVIGEDGKVSVTPGTQVDGPITVTVTDPDLPEGKKEITVPVNGHEANRDDNESDKTMVEGDAKPVNPTDESQDTGIVIKNAGEDTKVTATDEDGNEIPAVIGEDGKVSVTPGTQVDGPITVTVTDPDLPEGKKEIEVPVNGHEANRDDNGSKLTLADKHTPVGKEQTVNVGGSVTAEKSIGNFKDLPEGTTAKFETPVDTTKPGTITATVVVSYTDGSEDKVTVTVKVVNPKPGKESTDADKYEPIGQKQTVNVGGGVTAEKSIMNFGKLPKGTKAEFETPIDTTTAGDKTGKVIVTYPDGSVDTIDVIIQVVDSNAGETPKTDDSTDNGSSETPEMPEKPEADDSTDKGMNETPKTDDSQASVPQQMAKAATLPETGESDNTAIFGAAALAILGGLGLLGVKSKKEEEEA
ncbi:Rib/alpha-like domain-containing protein [Aerococcaceae bacterium zg-1292]|uniref:Rib/alpha-like domain-containing protein n=1 Tax=Aerococcaceae bacterium zg-1292 TaxID=2774330 RepID=UPI001996BBCB|nr:YSIRK-type signal peptide-containing protein [Aerococcaceae bacterium zg-1292]